MASSYYNADYLRAKQIEARTAANSQKVALRSAALDTQYRTQMSELTLLSQVMSNSFNLIATSLENKRNQAFEERKWMADNMFKLQDERRKQMAWEQTYMQNEREIEGQRLWGPQIENMRGLLLSQDPFDLLQIRELQSNFATAIMEEQVANGKKADSLITGQVAKDLFDLQQGASQVGIGMSSDGKTPMVWHDAETALLNPNSEEHFTAWYNSLQKSKNPSGINDYVKGVYLKSGKTEAEFEAAKEQIRVYPLRNMAPLPAGLDAQSYLGDPLKMGYIKNYSLEAQKLDDSLLSAAASLKSGESTSEDYSELERKIGIRKETLGDQLRMLLEPGKYPTSSILKEVKLREEAELRAKEGMGANYPVETAAIEESRLNVFDAIRRISSFERSIKEEVLGTGGPLAKAGGVVRYATSSAFSWFTGGPVETRIVDQMAKAIPEAGALLSSPGDPAARKKFSDRLEAITSLIVENTGGDLPTGQSRETLKRDLAVSILMRPEEVVADLEKTARSLMPAKAVTEGVGVFVNPVRAMWKGAKFVTNDRKATPPVVRNAEAAERAGSLPAGLAVRVRILVDTRENPTGTLNSLLDRILATPREEAARKKEGLGSLPAVNLRTGLPMNTTSASPTLGSLVDRFNTSGLSYPVTLKIGDVSEVVNNPADLEKWSGLMTASQLAAVEILPMK